MATPTFWNKMCAALAGEVSADTLEAYRRASLSVYDALDHAEKHRETLQNEGKNAWTAPRATQFEILCTWNAFVLQTLGDQFLQADYEGDALTVGFVPRVTSDQIMRFYVQVEGWLNRAQQAHFNPQYELDIYVPAELPDWSEVEPCPNAHLVGMLEAMKAVRNHTEAALTFLRTCPPATPEQEKELNLIRQVHARASTKARYAEDMMTGNPTREVHERVEEHVKVAIEEFYLLGQLMAMPQLAGRVLTQTTGKPASSSPAPRPVPPAEAKPTFNSQRKRNINDPDFDMWCLTDPANIPKFKADRDAVKALKTLWQLDPDPAKTLAIQDEINAAIARGDLAIARDNRGRPVGHFFCCPWSPVYEARKSVTINGRRLKTLQQFVYNVTCEGVNLGSPFERDLLLGNFVPTTKFEYGDPNEPPDH